MQLAIENYKIHSWYFVVSHRVYMKKSSHANVTFNKLI